MVKRALLYVAGGMLLAAGLAVWFMWTHLQQTERELGIWKQNAQVAEETALRNRQSVIDMRDEVALRDRLLVERENENRALAEEAWETRRQLREARQEASDEIRECLDRPLPDAFDRILRGNEIPDANGNGR